MKIARPVINGSNRNAPAHYSSDCAMAWHQISNGLGRAGEPISLFASPTASETEQGTEMETTNKLTRGDLLSLEKYVEVRA